MMLARSYRQVHRALRVHGLVGTFRLAVEKVRRLGSPPPRPSSFDTAWHVETDGNEDLSALTIVNGRRPSPYENRYQPTAETIVREMIESLQRAFESDRMENAKKGETLWVGRADLFTNDLHRHTFIDVGSGKGRVLLVASEYPFRKIIGVEFARDLHDIAVQNVKAYRSPTQRCRDISLECADATTYRMPGEPTVLFMANPFEGGVMDGFLRNVEQSLREHPRPFYVLYRQAKESAMWDASPHFQKIASTPMFETYRAKGVL